MIPESEYHELVASWLRDSFNDVEHEVYLPSGRYPDFVAYTPFDSYIIEVENSVESLYESIGQCAVYSEETGHNPVVVFPADDAPGTSLIPDWLEVVTV